MRKGQKANVQVLTESIITVAPSLTSATTSTGTSTAISINRGTAPSLFSVFDNLAAEGMYGVVSFSPSPSLPLSLSPSFFIYLFIYLSLTHTHMSHSH